MDQINGQLLKQMLESGMNNLGNHSGEIDALNVFPVPDGDTGTNMFLTFSNGAKAALDCKEDHVGKILKALSRGLLMGATVIMAYFLCSTGSSTTALASSNSTI